ncbi:MAG: hypothetical protein NTY61_01685, partial [Candidatus Parcubacteria bacterium]|nr:hypothetical protein [Candidatus Parcubacteria bacterium]
QCVSGAGVMVGLSGGKDSSATLYQIQRLGCRPLAFTLDTGYLPGYILRRAKAVAKKIGVDHQIIPLRPYLTASDRQRFGQLAKIYERDRPEEFRQAYVTGRVDYSGLIRPCWICRRILIRAYYQEALKYGVRVVVLAINEWASLKSATQKRQSWEVSAMRRIKPFKNKPAVYIVHWPFLQQMKLKDTRQILRKIGWRYYQSVQSNASSCLLAKAAERPLKKNLGFHPDTTRLAREVTIGFLTKAQAKQALAKTNLSKYSVPQILRKAKLI